MKTNKCLTCRNRTNNNKYCCLSCWYHSVEFKKIRRKAGIKASIVHKRLGIGFYNSNRMKAVNLKTAHNNRIRKIGIFSMTKRQRSEAGKIGGKIGIKSLINWKNENPEEVLRLSMTNGKKQAKLQKKNHTGFYNISYKKRLEGIKKGHIKQKREKLGLWSKKVQDFNNLSYKERYGENKANKIKRNLSKIFKKTWRSEAGDLRASKMCGNKYHTKAKGGYYNNVWMRSSWEIDYVKQLDSKSIKWKYEPKVFKFKNGKRYIPDFYLPATDEYIEIKGWMDNRSIRKIKLFKKEYPKLKLTVIGKK